MNEARHILLVDDEPAICKFLRISLEAHGYRVSEARTGAQALALGSAEAPDLVVLDLGLPDMDGQQVLRRLREWSSVPVIVLSVRADEEGKVAALDGGANDYVTKPFGISELLARIRALLRDRPGTPQEAPVFELNGLKVDRVRRRVWVGAEEVRLSPKEYELLRMLVSQPDQVLTHRSLLRSIWGPAQEQETHYLRVLVGHLRQKLGDDPTRPRYIVTEPGVGYRLRGD